MTLIASSWDSVIASTVGRSHHRARRGSQDACALRLGGGYAVAVVCDGCSGGESSEVGAGLGARFLAADLARRLRNGSAVEDIGAASIAALVDMLKETAQRCSVNDDDVTAVIASCLLFTVQVAVIAPERYCVFGVGDGLVRVNGRFIPVPAPTDGAPDCPAYRLVNGLDHHASLRVHASGAASSLRSITIATDGALELAALTTLPEDHCGALALFEQDERFVLNPSLATKHIAALGPQAPEDDCTVVVLRRRGPAQPDQHSGTVLGELDGGGMSCT